MPIVDAGAGSAAFVGVPEDVDVEDLRRRIWDLTQPQILVDIEERQVEGSRVLLLGIEAGFELVRVGKLAEPLPVERRPRVGVPLGLGDPRAPA